MKICTVIVTYNRKKLLVRCLTKCLAQNIPTDVIIFDNASTDGTKKYLEENNFIANKRVIYICANENLGGAGGFYEGLKKAYESQYDYIWLMDDDGYPDNSKSLKKALDCFEDNPDIIVNSLVLSDNGGTKLSFATGGERTKADVWNKYPDGKMWDSISPFNGTLLSREVIEKIGFPKKEFFIKGDETEYICRAKKHGIKVLTALESEYRHPMMLDITINFLGRKISYNEESYWKEYYKSRNYVYIYKKYFPKTQLLKHYIYTFIKCFMSKTDRKRRNRYMLKGLIDGTRGKFGALVKP